MPCRHLQYRETDGETEFETARAYCAVADRFVQPLRADVCNARYDLTPAADCEIYRDHAGMAWDDPPSADPARDGVDLTTGEHDPDEPAGDTDDESAADASDTDGETAADASDTDGETAADASDTDGESATDAGDTDGDPA